MKSLIGPASIQMEGYSIPLGAFGAGVGTAAGTGGTSLMLQALPLLGSLLGGLFTGGGGKVPAEQRRLMDSQRLMTDKQREVMELERLLQSLMLNRKQAQDPQWRALQSMTFERLPVFAKQGFDVTSAMANPITSAPPAPPAGSRQRPPNVPPTDTAIPRLV
jgi:hypothetical protein